MVKPYCSDLWWLKKKKPFTSISKITNKSKSVLVDNDKSASPSDGYRPLIWNHTVPRLYRTKIKCYCVLAVQQELSIMGSWKRLNWRKCYYYTFFLFSWHFVKRLQPFAVRQFSYPAKPACQIDVKLPKRSLSVMVITSVNNSVLSSKIALTYIVSDTSLN